MKRDGDGRVALSLDDTKGALAEAHAKAVSEFYREMSCQDENHDHGLPSVDQVRRWLAGRNLACWCPPGLACHADVLLEIANEPDEDLGLFDAAEFRKAPEPEASKELGADARRTLRQQRELAEGKHPATKAPLHADAAPVADRTAPGLRCGSCAHLWRKHAGKGTWTKCDRKLTGISTGPDIRQWWPACALYEEANDAE